MDWYCIYRAYFKQENDYALMHADVNRDKEQYEETNDAHDQAMISYLINILLLHRDAAFPVARDTPEHNILAEWSQVGKAMFTAKPSPEEGEDENHDQRQTDRPQEFVRIIPIQRFTGLPAPPQIPYTFYADASYLYGSSLADCYALVKGIKLPAERKKKHITPYMWRDELDDIDAPLMKLSVSRKGTMQYDDYPSEWLEKAHYVVLRVPQTKASKDLDVFPATWKALSYIVSDPVRMGARTPNWDMDAEEYASARVHALFKKVIDGTEKGLLACHASKESLCLTRLNLLPDPGEELKYYHYLNTDSGFTNKIVELFGISNRCWHGCGYIGWYGEPLCRIFLLRNRMTAGMKISIMKGSAIFRKPRGKK